MGIVVPVISELCPTKVGAASNACVESAVIGALVFSGASRQGIMPTNLWTRLRPCRKEVILSEGPSVIWQTGANLMPSGSSTGHFQRLTLLHLHFAWRLRSVSVCCSNACLLMMSGTDDDRPGHTRQPLHQPTSAGCDVKA